jgi:hypothetical protein
LLPIIDSAKPAVEIPIFICLSSDLSGEALAKTEASA